MIVNDILYLTVVLITSKIKRNYFSLILLAVVVTSLLIIIITIKNETFAQPLTTPIEVGISPVDLAVNSKTNMIYVANQDSDTVSVINGTTNSAVTDITVGKIPQDIAVNPIAVNPNTNLIYVANQDSNSVSVIDGVTNSLVTNITIVTNMGEEQERNSVPYAVAINPGMNTVYVADKFNDIVSVINGSTNSIVTQIKVDTSPVDIAVNPNTNLIYVANQDSDTVSVINCTTNNIVTNAAVARGPDDLAVNTDTNMIYVINQDANRVSVINGSTNTMVKILTLGSYSSDMRGPADIAVNHHTNMIYVTNQDANRVSVINGSTNSILKTTLGNTPIAVDVNPATNMVYVASWLDDTVSVIDGSTNSVVIGETNLEKFDQEVGIKVGASPTAIAVNPNTNKIYVANQDSNTISVINGNSDSVINTVKVDSRPVDLAFDPDTNYLYVVNSGSNTTSVIDTVTDSVIEDKIDVGFSPAGVAVDPDEQWIYVAYPDSNTVYVMDGATYSVEEKFTVGYSPVDIALDRNTQMIYTANEGPENQSFGSVSVISRSMGDVVANLTIGGNIENREDSIPTALDINPNTNMVYVADKFNDIVSVLDDYTDSIIANITVGGSPVSVSVNPNTNMVYVANWLDDTVSVINGTTNSVVADDVIVGRDPVSVSVNPNTNLIYVANQDSDTVSVINGTTNSIVAGVTYSINPPNSGVVYCNGQKISNNDHKMYDIDTEIKCEAKANSAFPPSAFSFWSVFPPITFDSWSGNIKSSASANANNPNPTFTVSDYETLTFNFKEWIPSEYIKMIAIPIILGLILSGITAWIAWLFTRRRRKYLGRYMKAIEAAYQTSKQNKEDCFRRLSEIRRQITELFGRGKISDSHYEILNEKISEYIEKVNK